MSKPAAYISVQKFGDVIYHKFIDEDGIRHTERVPFKPWTFFPDEDGEYKSLVHGTRLSKHTFDSIKEYKAVMKKMRDSGRNPYGDLDPKYQFIAENYKEKPSTDLSKLRLFYYDIETDHNPAKFDIDPEDPHYAIWTMAITDTLNEKRIVLGVKEADSELLAKFMDADFEFVKCDNERDLLRRFLGLYSRDEYPDMTIGWNSQTFDDPYTYARITEVVGEDMSSMISPLGFTVTSEREKVFSETFKKPYLDTNILGIQQLDLMDIYKKFVLKPQPRYNLETISSYELSDKDVPYGTGKLKHEFTNLKLLYEGDYQTFVHYNAVDTDLMERIAGKTKLLDIVADIAYMTGSNFEDSMKMSRVCYNYLSKVMLDKKLVFEPYIPAGERHIDNGVTEGELHEFMIKNIDQDKFPGLVDSIRRVTNNTGDERKRGGFVLIPRKKTGKYFVAYDVKGMYPAIMMSLGVSHESQYIPGRWEPKPILDIMKSTGMSPEEYIEKRCYHSPNGAYYSKDIEGVIKQELHNIDDGRRVGKDAMLELEEYMGEIDAELRSREN